MLSKATVTVSIKTILLDFDGPELLVARDIAGAAYLCLVVSDEDAGANFVAVQISDERLRALRRGDIDLRSVFIEPVLDLHYEGHADSAYAKSIRLVALPELPGDWLPDVGFFLTDFEDRLSDEEVVSDAMRQNTAVVVFRLSPPESLGLQSKIDVDRLADCLRGFQSMVRHATKAALSGLSEKRRGQYEEDAYVMQVLAFSPGSFNVQMEAKYPADLIGASIVGNGIRQIDDLMALSAKSADEALDTLKKIRVSGHLLASYESFMRLLDEQDLAFEYRWSEPAMLSARGHRITAVSARSMRAVLKSESVKKSVPVIFVGKFTSVNTDKKPHSWHARDTEDRHRTGVFHESAPYALDGVTIKTQQYNATCEERLVQLASGKETLRLFLKKIESV